MSLFKYKILLECPNCKCKQKIKIPKGLKVIDYLKNVTCTCGYCNVEFEPEWK